MRHTMILLLALAIAGCREPANNDECTTETIACCLDFGGVISCDADTYDLRYGTLLSREGYRGDFTELDDAIEYFNSQSCTYHWCD